MKSLLLGTIAVAFLSTAAFAEDPMAGLYNNTVVTKDSAGGVGKIHVNADKTYSGMDAKGGAISGKWENVGGKTCWMAKVPAPAAGKEKSCGTDFSAKKVGDTFDVTMDDGAKYSASVVAGK